MVQRLAELQIRCSGDRCGISGVMQILTLDVDSADIEHETCDP
ncbi:MAG: hypothetical protein QM775_22235 [Pirellulales bacterium]